MVRRADAVAVATVLSQYTHVADDDSIETVTQMSLDETIKGLVTASATTFDVHEPGGIVGDRAMIIPGVPRFTPGQRLILFLTRTPQGTWAVTDLVLGKFRMVVDRAGQRVAARDEEAIVGWDRDLTPHMERRRQTDAFLDFLREEAKGAVAKQDYFVSREPIVSDDSAPVTTMSTVLNNQRATTLATFTPRSYTFDVSGGPGARWTLFPGPVTFFTGATQEPGAPGGGVTAVQTALASWDNDCASNVNYVYGGTDSTHTRGLSGADGENTVLFERDLSSYGVPPFSCSSNSYSGTLGIGGVTTTSGQHTFAGDTFYTTGEGDVEMNRGLANCTLLFSNGDFNSAVTHEIGHTLGFRHSDQTRADNPNAACTSDPTLECSSHAIMTAFVTSGLNAALQPWDVNAVRAVYPGGTCGSTCTPPSITTNPQSQTINAGGSVTLTVTSTGTGPLTYQWYAGNSGFTGSPVPGGTGTSITVSPTVTSSYWVRVSNACGSVNSATAVITVVTFVARHARGDFNGDNKSDVFWRNRSTGQNMIWFMNGATPTPTTTNFIGEQSWTVRAIADFNGDGRADVFWRDTSGQTLFWFMNGATVTQWYGLVVFEPTWQPAGAGDFDGDGIADVFWHNSADGENDIWFMHGMSISPAYSWGMPILNMQPVAFGDFNNDGRSDVFWRNSVTGENGVWLMNGPTPTGASSPTVADTNWKVYGVGDFNHDGKEDIFWHHGAGSNMVWLMDGASPTPVTLPSTPSNLVPILVGDFDGNGSPDILWRDSGTGQVSVWLMNGLTVTTNTAVSPISTDWQPFTIK